MILRNHINYYRRIFKKETFLFDYIKSKDDLKIPINYHNLMSEPSHEEIKKFNNFLIQIYHDKNVEL